MNEIFNKKFLRLLFTPYGRLQRRPFAYCLLFYILIHGKDYKPRSKKVCYKCGKPGHFIAKCPMSSDSDRGYDKKGRRKKKKRYYKKKGGDAISDSLILYILEIIVLWRKNFQKSMRWACRFHLIFQMTQKILIMRR